jgi:DNA-binding NarL/FixJ family response regulator
MVGLYSRAARIAPGYLMKEEAPEVIVEAAEAAQGQQGWVSRRIVAQILSGCNPVNPRYQPRAKSARLIVDGRPTRP